VRAARLEGARRERVGHGATGGALAGKTIYVSAGHGWIWDDALGRWRTQRGNTNGLVEDFISAETVAQHLIPMLRDMGAYVVPVRESSMQRQLVIVDDVDAGFTVDGATATAIADGWARPPEPIPDGRNPFAGGGSVELPVVAGGAAAARWVLDVPADGDYEVYVSWVQGADRAPDAPYVVHHAGGDSGFRVDQRRHGSTWVLLGQFHFAAGTSVEHGSIELGTDASAGAVVSADAVRLGGGMGHVDRGGGAVDRPAYESGARYAAQYNGAPSSVWDYSTVDGNDDVGTRSRFSAWDHEAGEDAVYVAWHTNAPSPARGTSSFAYGPSSYGPLSEFSGVDGSLELMDAIHTELVGDLRADWDPAWQDRGEHTAYFGEVNPSHNPEMPATLIEVAFHDTVEDADALRDPRFRALAARAFAEGVARYFATRDGVPLILPPEPPAAPRMIQGDGGGLTLAWDPPDDDPAGGDAATGYRVYLSADGRAFDDGHDVTGTSLAIDAGPGGAPVFARVTATNAGGESRPSPVVGARPAWGPTVVLVVGGFTRIDGAMLIEEDLAAYDLATVQRGYEDRINDGSHAARHGLALAGAGYAFDVASAEAVRRGEVTLDGYAAISWLAGEELAPLGDADRAAVAAYLDGGGAFL
ncbi:MAG: N-acetylmuramoyl-L-alanine amidase, partial [Myxococcales bacterium]|nr:N-acetylmuramoyl-L-alanine amidase [Myxococcales bacterium]